MAGKRFRKQKKKKRKTKDEKKSSEGVRWWTIMSRRAVGNGRKINNNTNVETKSNYKRQLDRRKREREKKRNGLQRFADHLRNPHRSIKNTQKKKNCCFLSVFFGGVFNFVLFLISRHFDASFYFPCHFFFKVTPPRPRPLWTRWFVFWTCETMSADAQVNGRKGDVLLFSPRHRSLDS